MKITWTILGEPSRFEMSQNCGKSPKVKIKKSTIQNVDYFETRGGVSGFSIFSQIQNSLHYPGGGGQENYGLFPQFWDISNLDGSHNLVFLTTAASSSTNIASLSTE